MKRILLSILFAIMIIIGLAGTFFEGAMIYDRLTGEKINTGIVLQSTGSDALKKYAKIACEYIEEGRIVELREVFGEKNLRFAVYTEDGTPAGRYMTPEEEMSSVLVRYSTKKNNYIVKFNTYQVKIVYNDNLIVYIWTSVYGNTVIEAVLGTISLLLLVSGTVLFVLFAPPICKYLLVLLILFLVNTLIWTKFFNKYERLIVLAVEAAVLIAVGAFYISKISRLRKEVGELAGGNLNREIDVKSFPISLKGFATDIGRVSDSVSLAVDEQMKSERLKTELITNISHDLKTPLTSIINFSDLINNSEASEEEKAEYAEHLHTQSVRLKELLDALIEASKAASGAVEINMAPCDVHILLEQCVVEYEQKLNEAGLTLVESYPEEKLVISADAKFLSRIFENLLTNICKYSMPGSRAYVSAAQKGDQAVISFKNMSKEPLNVSVEELTERFVRGDASRHSEGHGLGLSIVKSLMDLQNGKLNMRAEADLFVAELSFPLLKEE